MTAREYLDRPEALRLEIVRKRARIDTLRRLATRFSALPEGVRVCSSPDPSRMQALLAEAADEEQAVRLLEEQRQQALAGAALLISRLPDADAARILEDCRMFADSSMAVGVVLFRYGLGELPDLHGLWNDKPQTK